MITLYTPFFSLWLHLKIFSLLLVFSILVVMCLVCISLHLFFLSFVQLLDTKGLEILSNIGSLAITPILPIGC